MSAIVRRAMSRQEVLVPAVRTGFDLSSYALAQMPEPVRRYCWQASLTDEIEGTYDLIVCHEVVAHLPLSDAERAVANFCRHTDDVLFSEAPYPPAPLHANTEPPEHWAQVFARHGFYRDFAFDAAAIGPWAVRYRRDGMGAEPIWPRKNGPAKNPITSIR